MRSPASFLILSFSVLFTLISCQTTDPSQTTNTGSSTNVASSGSIVDESRPDREDLSFYQSPEDAEKALEVIENLGEEKTLEQEKVYLALLLTEGRLEEAVEEADYWITLYPEDVDLIYLRSVCAYQLGNTPQAEEFLNKGLALNDQDSDLNLLKARLYLDKRDYTQANRHLSVTLKTDPDNFQALIQKSDVLMHLGQGNDDLNEQFLRESIKVLNHLEEVEPSYPYTYVDRARVLTVLGETGDAYVDYSKAIELEPQVEWHYLDRARLTLKYRNDRLDALEDLKKCEEIDPDNFLANVFMAGIYYDELEFDKSLYYYQKVIEARPEYYFAYEYLGLLYYVNGDYSQAKRAFLTAYDRLNDDEGYILMAALSMMQMDERKQALDLVTQVARSLERDSLAYEVFRYYLEGGSDYFVQEKIRKESNEELQKKFYFYLAELYLMQDSTGSAEQCFSKAQELDFGFEARAAQWRMAQK